MQGSPNSKSKEIIEINYIACTQAKNMQEFSFKLKLLNANLNEQELLSSIFSAIQNLIISLKPCLQKGKFFTYNQDFVDTVGGLFSTALYKIQGNHKKNKKVQIDTLTWSILRENFGSEIKAQNFSAIAKEQEILKILQQGITIKLRMHDKDIKLADFNQIKADLETDLKEKLKQAKNNEQSQIVPQVEKTQQVTTQNKQVVPFRGLFGCGVTNSGKQITRASIVVAAMRDNFSWFISFIKPFNFFNTVQFFFRYPPKLPTQKRKAITWHSEPQEVRQCEAREEKHSDCPAAKNPSMPKGVNSSEVKENQEEEKHITAEPTFMQKVKKSLGVMNDNDIQVQEIIKRAQGFAKSEMILNKVSKEQRTLDEIFCETVITYYDLNYPKFLMKIIESVFHTIFLKDISKKREISEEDILNTLKNFGLEFNKGYLMQQIERKKEMLNRLIQRSNFSCTSSVSKSEIQELYNFAQKKAQEAVENNKNKTLDEIFIEVMKNYRDQNRATFICIFDTVFNSIFCGDKNPDEIETLEEVFNILKLEVQFDAKYLEERVNEKKMQLSELVLDRIKSQPPTQPEDSIHKSTSPLPSNIEKNQTPRPLPAAKSKRAKNPLVINTAFKSSLETVFSSKEAYFCLFVIGVSISILCLWHLPLGEVPILQSLAQEGKREYIGLTLNIGLPILILLCVVNLADFVRYQYSIESIGQVNLNKHPSRT